jgi:hypothetical protein
MNELSPMLKPGFDLAAKWVTASIEADAVAGNAAESPGSDEQPQRPSYVAPPSRADPKPNHQDCATSAPRSRPAFMGDRRIGTLEGRHVRRWMDRARDYADCL